MRNFWGTYMYDIIRTSARLSHKATHQRLASYFTSPHSQQRSARKRASTTSGRLNKTQKNRCTFRLYIALFNGADNNKVQCCSLAVACASIIYTTTVYESSERSRRQFSCHRTYESKAAVTTYVYGLSQDQRLLSKKPAPSRLTGECIQQRPAIKRRQLQGFDIVSTCFAQLDGTVFFFSNGYTEQTLMEFINLRIRCNVRRNCDILA